MSRQFVLGGAQFGNGYGKFVQVPKLTPSELANLLEYSSQVGISLIDIAQSYNGCIENLSEVKMSKKFDFSTKIIYVENSEIDQERNLKIELGLLNKQNYHSILIHNWSTLSERNRFSALKFLDRLKVSNLTARIGISIYQPEEMSAVPFPIDIVQAPLNFFNLSFLKSKIAHDFRKAGVEFACRSIFHQGLMLSNDPNHLSQFPELLDFIDFCERNSVSSIQGALSVFDSQSLFSSLVVGVGSVNQLQDVTQSSTYKTNLDYYHERQYRKEFIDPRTW